MLKDKSPVTEVTCTLTKAVGVKEPLTVTGGLTYHFIVLEQEKVPPVVKIVGFTIVPVVTAPVTVIVCPTKSPAVEVQLNAPEVLVTATEAKVSLEVVTETTDVFAGIPVPVTV